MPPQTDFSGLRKMAINLNNTFSGIVPLMRQTQYLSLNAEIASAEIGVVGEPFAVVVRELFFMTKELSTLTDEVKDTLNVVNSIAAMVVDEKKLHLLQTALQHLGEQRREEEPKKEMRLHCGMKFNHVLNQRSLDEWSREWKRCGRCANNTVECVLWKRTIQNGLSIMENLKLIDSLATKILRLAERMRMIAALKSHFIGISAMIKAARVNSEGSGLRTVAENIQTLSKDISAMQTVMDGKVMRLSKIASQALQSAQLN